MRVECGIGFDVKAFARSCGSIAREATETDDLTVTSLGNDRDGIGDSLKIGSILKTNAASERIEEGVRKRARNNHPEFIALM
jgi:hypothetical protein